jgi:ABC-type sugar transport system permease subunit
MLIRYTEGGDGIERTMNDVLVPLFKAAPAYVLLALLLVWIVFKALPDSAQFFSELLPHRRKLARIRAILESIKAKAEAFEIAQKHNIQMKTSLEDALKNDLEAILGEQVRRPSARETNPFGVVFVEILYTIIVSIIAVIAVVGLIFSSSANANLKWSIELTIMSIISFLTSLVGGYAAWRISRDSLPRRKRLSFSYFLLTPAIAGIGGMAGALLGGILFEGVRRLLFLP